MGDNEGREEGLGWFPFSQNFQFNQLKCKWSTQVKWKFSRTNGQRRYMCTPPFSIPTSWNRIKVPFAQNLHFYCSHLHSLLALSCKVFYLQMRLQVFACIEKASPFDTEISGNFQLKILAKRKASLVFRSRLVSQTSFFLQGLQGGARIKHILLAYLYVTLSIIH